MSSPDSFITSQPRIAVVDPTVYGFGVNGEFVPAYGEAPEAHHMSTQFGRPEGPSLRSPVGGMPSAEVPAQTFGALHAPQLPALPEAHQIPGPMPGGPVGRVVQLGAVDGGAVPPGYGAPPAAGQAPMRNRSQPVPRPETPAEAAARAASGGISAPLGAIAITPPPSSDVRAPLSHMRTVQTLHHPQAGAALPYRGPGHSMPFNAGEPNFVPTLGGGLGVWANAPRPVTAYQGQAFPTGVPGTYMPNDGSAPVAAAFGALFDPERRAERRAARQDARAQAQAQRAAEANQRVVNLGDGYIYQQFSDGRIKVLKSADPRRLPHGSVLQPGTQRWEAVTGEIGSWQSYVQARRAATAGAVSQGLSAGADIAALFSGRGRGRGRKGRKAPPPDMPLDLPPEEPSGLPSWAPIAGLVLVGGLVLFAAQK